MSNFNKVDRKTFIKSMGAAVFGAAFGSWRAVAAANLDAASISIGYITDTFFSEADDPEKSDRLHPGRLSNRAFAMADDMIAQFQDASSGPVDLIIHGGNMLRSGKRDEAQAALSWLKSQKTPIHPTLSKDDSTASGLDRQEFKSVFSAFNFADGKGYYSYNASGFHFIHLDCPVDKNIEQQKWLVENLSKHENAPTILIVHDPLGKEMLSGLSAAHRNVLAALSAGLDNSADFDSGILSLSTCSPVIYPCGARIVKIDVSQGQITITSKFIQSRRLELVEESFHRLHGRAAEKINRLGAFKARRFEADSEKKLIVPAVYKTAPAIAPRIGSDSSVVIALVSDTHLCKDKYLTGAKITQYQEKDSESEMTGHFLEEGGKAIFEDILAQIAQGSHRVEFFDEIFEKNPKSENNFIDAPVDALLLTGDLSEHGMRDESQVVLDGLDALPDRIRQSTFVTPGNHDLFRGDFIEKDSSGSRKPFADFYKDYLAPDGSTYYSVQLAEWLSLIVLDSVIPTESSMSLIQDQIDWLEDQIAARKNQAVIVACHHPIYALSQVPRLMAAYLKARSHDTHKLSAARIQLQELFAKNSNVKLVLSGHSHGTVVDRHRKTKPLGSLPDDAFTTHIQIPCTVEYPNGYRLIKVSRSKNTVHIDYITAYTRLASLRAKSARAKIFSILGTDIKTPKNYRAVRNSIDAAENIARIEDKINSMDLMDLNVRGYKDGTTNNGLGNSGKRNINDKIEVTI